MIEEGGGAHDATDRPSGSSDRDVAFHVNAVGAGGQLTVIGCSPTDFVARLPPDIRPLLRLDLASATRVDAIIRGLLDDLAEIALAKWPAWPASDLAPWRRAADRLARAGRPPRFARVPPATQFCALHSAAGGPLLLVPIDPLRADRAHATIAAMEWARRHGAAIVALASERPAVAPPWDRILHGALTLAPTLPEPALSRLVPDLRSGPRGSAAERRLRTALGHDPELAGLFEDEVTLALGPLGPTPRVDLLWRAGKVVVELDGIEHERHPSYAADRHRDYELLVAGYIVLRLTNAEVELDLARSIEKIRRVVALRSEPR